MRPRLLLAVLACAAAPAAAGGFDSLDVLGQDEFHALAGDLGAAFSYKGVTPATPLGALGFDIGVEATDTRLEHDSLFARAGGGSQSHLFVPKLHVYKGLPFGFDIGAFVGGASALGASVFGVDARWALVDDGLAAPAVAVRLSGTRTSGMGNLQVSTAAVDLMASKKLTLFTPYLGGGVVRAKASVEGAGLDDETVDRGRVFAGANLDWLGGNVALEAERMGGATSLSAKLGLRF